MGKAGEFGDPGTFEGGEDLGIAAPFPRDQVVPHEFPAFGTPAEFPEHGACIADEFLGSIRREIKTLCKRLRGTACQFCDRVDVLGEEFFCEGVVHGRDLGKGLGV